MSPCWKVATTLLICAVGGVASMAACGSSSSGGFSSTGGGSPTSSSDTNDGSAAATPSGSDDSGAPTGVFTSSDAAPAGVVFDCKPGTYTGMFTTMVTSDAGGLLSLFSFNWTGNLSITLQGKVMSGNGEIPEPVLTIAPGATLSGVDSMGGHFNADLSGQLDCPSKTLAATVANGSYNYFGGDAGGIAMTGTLSATYDGAAATPELTGQMNLASPQLMAIGAVGTWSAALQ